MRLERLTLERYGAFTGRTLVFRPSAALHVVLGANEAGKTSALSAIGDFLFGFGARTDYDFRHDSKTLRIGAQLRAADGTLIAARRRKGNKNTLVDEQDQPLSDDLVARLLAGVTRQTFDSEFGLTSQALRDGGHELLKAGGRLAETLAASSAGMTALAKLKDRLQAEADDLFTARRAATKPFYAALERRDAADRALRDAVVTREAIGQAETAVNEARRLLGELNAAHAQAGATLARWQRTLRVKLPLARLDALGAELAALMDVPEVATASLAEWQDAFTAHAAVDRDIVALDQAAAADAAEIAALAVDDQLLAQGTAIDALNRMVGGIRQEQEHLPRRRLARDNAEASLNEAARRLGIASHLELLEKLPTDPALAQARSLIEQIKQAETAIRRAEERATRSAHDRDEFDAKSAIAEAVVDVDQARQRFTALGDIAGQVELWRRDSAMLKRDTDDLAAQLASLQPCPGGIETLQALPLPDGVAISDVAREIEIGKADIQRVREAIAAHDMEIAKIEDQLVRLDDDAALPTRADLTEARRRRDLQIDAARAAIDANRETRAQLIARLGDASHEIDRVTDRLLSDAQRLTRREEAQRRLVTVRHEREAQIASANALQTKLAEVERRWVAVWVPTGVVPRSPGEMSRWRDRVEALKDVLGKCNARQAALDALAASLKSARGAVVAFLQWSGRSVDAQLPIDVLYREAKARLDGLAAAWTEAKTREVQKFAIERELREATAERDAGTAALAALRKEWPAAMSAIGLSSVATPAHAEAALSVWQSVAVPKTNYETETHRVVTIEADLAAFDRDVGQLAQRVAPHLVGAPAQEALTHVSERLAQARLDAETCRRLREAQIKRATHRKSLVATCDSTGRVLDDACRLFGVSEIAMLAEPLQRAARKHALQLELAKQRRDLVESEGHDEVALRQERDGIDLDTLPAEIERQQLRQNQLLKEIETASAALHRAQSELDQLSRGRNAAAVAAERADAGADLVSIAERWLLRAAAARLASRAIERHRALVQDPLLERAGALFALATAGAFAGLGVDFGDDDQPVLVARRSDGERVAVAGLSEGTRDQLFLALRLALLERRTAEPLPFIGDDLLASFDEARTAATLRLLAEAGRARQIILFTHHRHVAELAGTLPGDMLDLVEL